MNVAQTNKQPRPDGFVNEPVTDFGLQIARDRMLRALRTVREPLGARHDPWIGGQITPTKETFPSVNPARFREVVGVVGKASATEAQRAIAAAKDAFSAWRSTPVDTRAGFTRRVAEVLRARRFELAAWEVIECGKQWREADADVAEAIDFCEYYALRAEEIQRSHLRREPGEDNAYRCRPRGVVVVIAPWNFPLAILCGMTMAPLATGNTVIMKPAEQSSVVAAKFAEVLREAELPAGVVNFLPGIGEEIGPVLVEHPDVAVVSFTGSRKVGLGIYRSAAVTHPGQRHVKHVLAEMGGKNAIIIDNDADVDEAVLGVVASAFGYQGQKCSACSRVVVLPEIQAVFLERLREATASLRLGPPEDPSFQIGPVIDAEARDRLLGVIELGKREARCLYAGDAAELAEEGYYVAPHIFEVDAPQHRLAQEEFFGPLLTILTARDLDHALEIANGTDYALTGGLFSRNPRTIERVKNEFDVGNLYINRKITGAEVGRQPFGGFKLSGTGSKAGGPDSLGHFVLSRTITENTLRRGFAPETGFGE